MNGLAHAHWYDYLFFGIAAAIVYPDKILEWFPDRSGKIYPGLYLLALELLAIGLVTVTMVLLRQHYPRLKWWEPFVAVCALAAVRIGVWLVTRLFGFDD